MKLHQPKILFVSHDASRTGAPIVFLHLLRWLKRKSDIDGAILLLSSGVLEGEFSKIYPTTLWDLNGSRNSLVKRVYSKIWRRINRKSSVAKVPRKLRKETYDLIYLNTAVSAQVVASLKKNFQCPVICHIHENEYTLSFYYPDALNQNEKKFIDHFIAVSKDTRANLIRGFKIPAEKISLCYESIPVNEIRSPTIDRKCLKDDLGIEGKFIVGGSGLTIWRKGIDLFIQLAVELKKLNKNADIKFLWLGEIDHQFKCAYEYEKMRLGISDDVVLLGVQEKPQNYFQLFDVFALTSREDPFPLVCLEAACLGKPILCFDSSGGMAEFLGEERDLIIPYGDVRAMASKILELKEDKNKLKALADVMQNNAKMYDVEKVAPQIEKIIRSKMHHSA